SVIVTVLVVWLFAGRSLQTTDATHVAEQAPAPPVQIAKPAPVAPAPIAGETPKPATGPTAHIRAAPPLRPPLASTARPGAPAVPSPSRAPEAGRSEFSAARDTGSRCARRTRRTVSSSCVLATTSRRSARSSCSKRGPDADRRPRAPRTGNSGCYTPPRMFFL